MAFGKFVKFTVKNVETGEVLQERDYTKEDRPLIDKVMSNKTARLRFDNLNHLFEPALIKPGDKVHYAVKDELTGVCKEIPLEVAEVVEVKTMKF